MLLQNECGYTGALPYWDEQRDLEVLGTIEKASVWGSDELSFGTNGVNVNGLNCVIDGAFANMTLRMDQIYGIDYYDEYCLQREFNQTRWETANQTGVDICHAKTDYDSANFCFVDAPHSCGHLATGGTVGYTPILDSFVSLVANQCYADDEPERLARRPSLLPPSCQPRSAHVEVASSQPQLPPDGNDRQPDTPPANYD